MDLDELETLRHSASGFASERSGLPERAALLLKQLRTAMVHCHRGEMRDEAVALQREARGGGRLGRARRIRHRPAAAHAKVHVHDHVRRADRREEGEQVLPDRLDPRELATVDEARAVGEAAIRTHRPELATHEARAVRDGDAVDRVPLDHVRSEVSEDDRR